MEEEFFSSEEMVPIWSQRDNLEQRVQELEQMAKSLKNWENSLRTREKNVSAQEEVQRTREQENENLLKIKTPDKKWRKIKATSVRMTLFPNQSSIKLIRTLGTNELIWEDPNDLVRNDVKAKIEISLQQTIESNFCNSLFDSVSFWFNIYIPFEAYCFVQKLMLLISEKIDVKRLGKYNRTPLMFAAFFDTLEAVIQLINRGAKIKAVNAFGQTALHFAARFGSESSCRVLLQHGANFNAQAEDGFTSLIWAAQNGHVGVVKMLLNAGADTLIKNNFDQRALDVAKPNCQYIIKEIQDKGTENNLKI